ncbi:xylulokinase [Gymnodinialimonas sp. 57CJ19]|uniref:xylulokinase n=1 Tax=Gymnodinialimonas sp. 57CJ19 TaxID=3138498 RepID=UPI003134336D
MSYLGIDLGTSGLRALLIDAAGRPVGSAECAYQTSHPQSGWSEQDPAVWIQALEQTVATLRANHDAFADLQGIGVAGHMHGATLLDRDDKVLRPCILWNDTRSHAEAATLDANPAFRAQTGNIVFPGFTAPKIAWVRSHEPEIYEQIAKVLLPAAYLNLYLTGEHVADKSDSAGTAWLDMGSRDWSADLLAAGHTRADQMPRLVEGSAPAGMLRKELARSWGVGQPVTVAGGAGDNAAAACGVGALKEGFGFVSLGTSGVLLAARSEYCPAPETALHTFCHAVPDTWYQMGVMLSATDSLNWLSKLLNTTPRACTERLGDTLKGPGRVGFLPYLSGERTPHNDADIRGAFTGLGHDTDLNALTHATIEGVCYGLRDSAEAMRATGAQFEHMFAVGGGASSRYWLQMLATVLDMPLNVPHSHEIGAALGAARLGQAAAAGSRPAAIMHTPDIRETIAPDPALTDAYEQSYQRFRATYPAIKSIKVGG